MKPRKYFIFLRYYKYYAGGGQWMVYIQTPTHVLTRPLDCFITDTKWNGFNFFRKHPLAEPTDKPSTPNTKDS